jgi:hypothetical protein
MVQFFPLMSKFDSLNTILTIATRIYFGGKISGIERLVSAGSDSDIRCIIRRIYADGSTGKMQLSLIYTSPIFDSTDSLLISPEPSALNYTVKCF